MRLIQMGPIPVHIFKPNFYYKLGSRFIRGLMLIALDSLMEGHWRILHFIIICDGVSFI